MLFIETFHRTVRDLLVKQLSEKSPTLDQKVNDFDCVYWHIIGKAGEEGQYKVAVSLLFTDWESVSGYDFMAYLNKVFGEGNIAKAKNAQEDYNVTFRFDLTEGTPDLCEKIASLRTYMFIPAFLECFEKQKNGEKVSPATTFTTRPGETVYILSNKENLCVCICLDFPKEDELYASVVLSESADLQKREPNLRSAPAMAYSPTKFDYITEKSAPAAGHWVEFVLFKNHLTEKVATQILFFRTYISSMIKSEKTYVHTQMRNKVDEALKVLNRAEPKKEKKEKN